ncbi:hypothetical protein C8R44DRAFT_890665 [Mycena epipterygia]|nr:hypothetical protein C8R44DRAFT_890665 [Mycena epipterygia]
MTADPDSSAEYADASFIALLANLDLADLDSSHDVPATTPPRTLSPRLPETPLHCHMFPAMHRRTQSTGIPTVYQFDSPTKRGYTTEWSTAGAATQGVSHSFVRTVQTGSCRKKIRTKKAAYVVFAGRRFGVFFTWAETEPLVKGVPHSIFRGYTRVDEANTAFAYALQRSWVRLCDVRVEAATFELPLPILVPDALNALHTADTLDGTWYIVYRGITPGVYRSHLECQLNTLGVSGALHESVVGKAAAIAKYAAANHRGHVGSAPPLYPFDVFS